jgi:hypothetical protein
MNKKWSYSLSIASRAAEAQKRRPTPMGLEPTIFAMQLKPESNALPLGQGAFDLMEIFRIPKTI